MAVGEIPSRYVSAGSFSLESKIGGIVQALTAGAVLGAAVRAGNTPIHYQSGYHYPVPRHTA